MIDVTYNGSLKINAVDAILRNHFDIVGVTVNSSSSRVHTENEAQVAGITAFLNAYGSLVVTANKTTMNEGEADPVVTCSDAVISGDASVGYVVLLDGQLYASGTDTVTAGSVSLTLVDPVAGDYDVFVYRLGGSYACGYVTIEVN